MFRCRDFPVDHESYFTLPHAFISLFIVGSEGQDSGHKTTAVHFPMHPRSIGHGGHGAFHRGELIQHRDC